MPLDKITREEFDPLLEHSTERIRRERITLEARAAELEDLIGRYSSVPERIEAEGEPRVEGFGERREELNNVLTELAARTSDVAAAL